MTTLLDDMADLVNRMKQDLQDWVSDHSESDGDFPESEELIEQAQALLERYRRRRC